MLNNNFLDAEHKFDLAIQLGDLDCAYTLAKESASEQKWKQLAELATSQAKFELAQQYLHEPRTMVTCCFLPRLLAMLTCWPSWVSKQTRLGSTMCHSSRTSSWVTLRDVCRFS